MKPIIDRPVKQDNIHSTDFDYIKSLEAYIDYLTDNFPDTGKSLRQNIFDIFTRQTSLGIFYTDRQGKLIYWNSALEGILGVPQETSGIWQFLQMLHIDVDENDTTDGLAAFIHRYKNAPWVTEHWIIVQTEIKCIKSTLFPICFDQTIIVGGIVEDISEQRVNESESQRYKAMLEKQVEARTQKLTDTRIQLQVLSNNIPNGFLFRKVHANNRVYFTHVGSNAEKTIGKMLGTTPGDMKYFVEHIHPDDRKRVTDTIENAATCFMDIQIQYRFYNDKNELLWLEESETSHPGQNGSIVTDGYIIDITGRKNAEKSLFLHLERQKTISRVLHELHNPKDLNASLRNVLEWTGLHLNSFYAKIILHAHEKFPPQVISWKSPQSFGNGYPATLPEEKKQDELQEYKIVENQHGTTLMYPIIGKEKQYGMFAFSRLPEVHPWEPHEIDTLSNISQITSHALDLYHSFTAIHHSYLRFNSVLDNMDPYIYVTDVNTFEILFVNKTVRDLEKDIEGSLEGKICWNTIRKKNPKLCEDCKVRELLDGKMSKHSFKYYNERLGRHFEKTSSIIPWTGGHMAHLSVSYDISEQVRMLEDLKAAKDKAEESDKLKTVFLANMSHEIRTPMNGIIGFAALLEQEEHSPKLQPYIEQITENSNILIKLIEDILDISQIEANMVRLWTEECRLHRFFKELHALFLPILEKKGKKHIDLILDIPEKDTSLTLDFIRLRQILSNLLDNAVKFTDQGCIRFGYRLQEGHLLCYVEDTGIGIPKSKNKIIFERFRQVEEHGYMRNYGGSGLGLSIAKGLATRLGGKIELRSEQGKGSRFEVKIPVKTLSEIPAQASPVPAQSLLKQYAGKWAGTKVLIVEDEAPNYLLLKKIMESLGISSYRACDGIEALEMLQSIPDISIIFMDIKMPRMDGITATRTIKKERPQIPVVAQTAYAMPEDIEAGKKAGFDSYLIKPLSIPTVIDTLKTFIPLSETDAVGNTA